MRDEKERPIMSQEVVNSGSSSSIAGYLNTEEFMKALSKGVGWTSFSALGVAVLIALGESVHLWYTGPLAPTVIAVMGVIVGYLRSRKIGQQLMDEGDSIDDVR